ncbi:hypothetical protein DMN91_001663 [Ooceraea biroi]|uniref:CCHC-type domain-containing protein n=1 Tax=Ooceraea biroi TaxID=2015173 RepID=A0A3L8DYJ7_OOCBI|nr:hypothetical protein DMN91_001663 [Ooceraea biroi]
MLLKMMDKRFHLQFLNSQNSLLPLRTIAVNLLYGEYRTTYNGRLSCNWNINDWYNFMDVHYDTNCIMRYCDVCEQTTCKCPERRRGQPLARRPCSRGSSAVEVEGVPEGVSRLHVDRAHEGPLRSRWRGSAVCASCMEPEDGEEEEVEEREEGEGKSKEVCTTCGKTGHLQKNYRKNEGKTEMSCIYCKATGHQRNNCPKLKAKEQTPGHSQASRQTMAAVSTSQEESAPERMVAYVQPDNEVPRGCRNKAISGDIESQRQWFLRRNTASHSSRITAGTRLVTCYQQSKGATRAQQQGDIEFQTPHQEVTISERVRAVQRGGFQELPTVTSIHGSDQRESRFHHNTRSDSFLNIVVNSMESLYRIRK